MANNVAASMKASIIIDKKEIISSALSAYAEAQKEIAGNKIELLVDVSDDKARERLKEISKELAGKDYVIKFKNQGIEETMKSLDELFGRIKDIINLSNGINLNPLNLDTNIHVLQQEEAQIKKVISSYEKLLDLKHEIKNVGKSSYSGKYNTDWIGYYKNQEDAIKEDLANKKQKLNSSLNLILSEDKNALASLEGEANKLKTSLQSVQDMVNRISSNSSLANLEKNENPENLSKKYAEAYKAIDDRLAELGSQYKLTNAELEEFITLQVKAEKIMEKMASQYGGVQGSGAKNKAELRNWIEKTFAGNLGLNPEDVYNGLFRNITDTLYSGGRADNALSLFDEAGTKRSLRDISAEILKYKSTISGFDGSFGAKEDTEKLKEISSILSYIKKNASEIESTDFSAQIKKASEAVEAFSKELAEGGDADFYSKALEEARQELRELIELQERLDVARGKKVDDNQSSSTTTSEQLEKQERQTLATAEAQEKLVESEKNLGKSTNLDEASAQIDKLQGKLEELSQKYKELSEDMVVSGKDVDLVNNEEFQKLSKDFSKLKQELSDLKAHMGLVEQASMSYDAFIPYENKINSLSIEVETLTNKLRELSIAQKNLDSNGTNISSPMKDTFQGDKIEQATTSAKELDKTLEGVEIPKESFNEVIAKFNIIEEKAKNIAKIVRSDIKNADGTYNTSYNVKYKDGSSEILGENSNPQKLRSQNVLYDAKQIEKETKALERAAKQAQKLAEEKRKARQADKQATQSSVDKALKDQLDAWEAIQKIRLQIAQTDEKDTTKLQNLNEQKKALQKQYNEAGKVLKANKDLYNQTEQQVKLEHERLETNEKINKLKLNNVDVGSVLSKGDSDLKKFEARKNQSEEYRSTVEKLKQSIEELRVLEQSMVKSKLLPDGEAQKINEAVASIEEYTNAIKNMPAVEKGSDEGSRTKLANRIHEYMDKNTRMTREFREEFENLIRVLRSGDDSVNIKDIARQFEDVKFRVKEAKQEGISFFDIFKNKAVYGFAARLAQYYLSFYDFIRYARYAVQSVIEFDTALTEMRKVSDESISTLERLQKATFNLADGVGTTALELQKSIADFMRIGESLEDATKSAQDANVLFRVSEFDDVTQATDALVAMSSAYKDLEKSQINDVLNEIGNNYAISTDELASALQKSAATLSVAGNDIYEAAALVTAGNTVLQDADSVGTGLKMISLRILGTQEAKDELASLGENVDDFVVQTKSKIDQTVRNYTAVTSNGFKGISVLDDNGNYRSTYEILRDISDVYQEIIETDKKAGTNRGQALLEVLAGKNRSNVAASILQSPEILESAYESALNSAGSAQEELNKYLESADGKVQELKNQLQEFWSVLLDSGTLKTIISSLTTILETATELVDTLGTLGTIGLGAGLFAGVKNFGKTYKCMVSNKSFVIVFEYALHA